ncbi:AraC family transcriptional regulator [Hahella ganghwensis]|uniref:AraC family transcriptional regulator n=1 Tax=Hahella ganghwensis TaxID=286420 RepID=UPI000378F746|nr:AraC family transcriptional regulator [Hahella ganghwensis]
MNAIRSEANIPPLSDPLGETLHLLRLSGILYCRSELTAPWGMTMPPMAGYMMFHIVTAGRCWLEVDGEPPRLLEQGSLSLVPHGIGHTLRSDLDCEVTPLFDIPVESLSERYEYMRHGGGGELTQMTCCVIRFDQAIAQQFITMLPRLLHIDAWRDDEHHWLQSTVRLMTSEAKEVRPGGETVMTHLADILMIQALRYWLDHSHEADKGWLAALRDRHIGSALALIHRYPGRAWSVAGLASQVGMSRSAFAARFNVLVGQSPMQYLTYWRMQRARIELSETKKPTGEIAESVGYQSEAAFSRAFKNVFGQTPGTFRNNADFQVSPQLITGIAPIDE